jgi:DnaK suppressor protein
VAKKPALAAKKGAAKVVAPAVNLPPRRMKAVPRPPTPGPTVRPLGVLPPEARARGIERPAHAPVAPPRPPSPPARSAKPAPKAPGPQRVTEKDLKELETLLLEERVRVMKEMGHLESTVLKVNPRESAGDLSGYSFHMADAGTDAYEREKAFQFASNEGRLLLDLDEALRRLYRGEYGSCESCGSAIAKARLEAMPTARLCRDCKEKEERENRPQQ